MTKRSPILLLHNQSGIATKQTEIAFGANGVGMPNLGTFGPFLSILALTQGSSAMRSGRHPARSAALLYGWTR